MKSRMNSYSILYICLVVFFGYTIWFQNLFLIPGMLPVLGVLVMAASFISIRGKIVVDDYEPLYPFLLYTVFIVITSIAFGLYKSISTHFVIQHLEYLIPLFAIFVYANQDIKRLSKLYEILVFAILMLCFTALINPTNDGGSITVGNMNPNTFATFLTILEMMCFFLLSDVNCSRKKSFALYIIIAIGFILTIQSASRRGLIVNSVIIFLCILMLRKYKYNNLTLKNFVITIVLFGTIFVSVLYLFTHADNIHVFQRFAIKNYSGDVLREYYQQAAFELFKSRPIIGAGLGAVEGYIGVYSHSMYYELLACTGIVGTIIILGYFGYNIIYFIISGNKQIDTHIKLRYYLVSIFIFSILLSGIACTFIYDLGFFIFYAIISSEKSLSRAKDISM